MKQVIHLDGTWQLGVCDVGAGALTNLPPFSYQCPVPGDVHEAFLLAGEIMEPLIGLNSKDQTWLEEKEFWYQRRFFVEEKDLETSVFELTFEGLDLVAEVFVNGCSLGVRENAFIAHTFHVTNQLQAGENQLLVRIDGGKTHARKKDIRDMDKMWNEDEPSRVWMRKPQFVYGWDWTIWLETCGIWKGVYLTCFDAPVLGDVFVHDNGQGVPKEGQARESLVEVEIKKPEGCMEELTLSVFVREDARFVEEPGLVASLSTQTREDGLQVSLSMEDARLWWCNGLGDPYLYEITVVLSDAAGQVLDTCKTYYGIKSISIREEELSATESGFTFVLNGVPVFVKGANHVPCDCLIGRIQDEKTYALVQMAADCNMNMLRVWGGGIYESEAFMEACDALGIMVWHDFMYACGYYPDFDEGFYENCYQEAVTAARRLRKHTSLIGWSGNNEIQEMYDSYTSWATLSYPYGERIFKEMLPKIVKEYCPGLIYRISSPYGGEHPADHERGDQHIWYFTHRDWHEHYLDLTHYTDYNIKFLSEFGIIGAMAAESVREALGQEIQAVEATAEVSAKQSPAQALETPAYDRESPLWLHHCNTSIKNKVTDVIMKVHFDNVDAMGLQEYVLKSQAIQADITQYLYDELRRRKFTCSGLLFWTLSDSLGMHNWSLVDYYLRQRPVYYALKRATAPISISVKGMYPQSFEGAAAYAAYYGGTDLTDVQRKLLEIWLCNDTLQEEALRVRYVVETFAGDVLLSGEEEVISHANAAECVLAIDFAGKILDPKQTILRAEVRKEGEVIAFTDYLFAPFKKLEVPKAKIRVEKEVLDANLVRLRLSSDTFVWMAHIAQEGQTRPLDNDKNLLPGETWEVLVNCADAAAYVPKVFSAGEE